MDETRIPPIELDNSALLLDIDGTLIDIASAPDRVVVPAGLRSTIARLHDRCGGALAFVSGRTLESIDALFAPPILPSVGCHGAQLRLSPGQTINAAPIPLAFEDVLAEVARIAPEIFVENKVYSYAIHYRLVPEAEQQILQTLFKHRSAVEAAGLEFLRGKAMVEIKSRAYNKGTALKALMSHSTFEGRRPVFLGDDTTDEDVFRVLPDFGGVGFSVGRSIEGAAGTFSSPADVRHWLAQLACEG